MKFSKGEWRYISEYDAVCILRDRRLMHVADFGKCELPEMETKHNALLISQAPDMYRLLKDISLRSTDRSYTDRINDVLLKVHGVSHAV